MNAAYLTDDISLMKNDFLSYMAIHYRLFWVVCAEFRKDKKAEKTDVSKKDLSKKWKLTPTYKRIKDLDLNRHLTDKKLWHDQIPNLNGLNASEFPKLKNKRKEYFNSVICEANNSFAEIVFWDLSTGLAPKSKNQLISSKLEVDPCYLYWEELKLIVEKTNGITCIYQHGRRQTWESIYQDYDNAIGRSIKQIDKKPISKTISRAKLIFIGPSDNQNFIVSLQKKIENYKPGEIHVPTRKSNRFSIKAGNQE